MSNTNRCAANIRDVIRSANNETKVGLIYHVISQIGIPAEFNPLPKSNGVKIFYRMRNDEPEQREWLLYENNKFFCVYCLCFSSLKNHRLIEGVEYVQKCRITETLNSHEFEAHHDVAKTKFLNIASGCDKNWSENRIVFEAIVKIIIFLATHG